MALLVLMLACLMRVQHENIFVLGGGGAAEGAQEVHAYVPNSEFNALVLWDSRSIWHGELLGSCRCEQAIRSELLTLCTVATRCTSQ